MDANQGCGEDGAIQFVLPFGVCCPCLTALEERVLTIQALYIAIFIGVVSFGFSQTQVVRRLRVVAALPMRLLILPSRDRLLLMLDPRYSNCCTTLSWYLSDGWRSVHILAQQFGLFEADGQYKVFAGLGKVDRQI